jgi:hypothetical protein
MSDCGEMFRIWDNLLHKYVDLDTKIIPDVHELEINIGLKDKDGIYIYENDVWQRDKPIYRNGRLLSRCPGRLGSMLVFHTGTKWSIEEEKDCESTDGFVIGTIHDVTQI